MASNDVDWVAWTRYYLGRAFELVGLVLVTWSMLLYFGSSEMRPMLALTATGSVLFFIGWLLARTDPKD